MIKTKIGYFPDDWKFSKLGKYCKVETGGTPRTGIREYYYPPEIPWMKSGEIKGVKIEKINTYISRLGLEKSAAKMLPSKSVMIALAGQGKTRGTTAPLEFECSCNQSAACMIPNEKLNYLFLHYHLLRLYKFIRNLTGEGREGLNLKLVKQLPLIIPPITEQIKIASIFDNIDSTIQITQRLIEKLTELKKGLIQKLFTEGIGHMEFKEVKLGGKFIKIPKEWELTKIKEIGKVIGGGTPNTTKEEYWSGEIKWLTPTEITHLNGRYISDCQRKITKLGLKKSGAKIIPPNSLILTSRASIGYPAINTVDVCTNQGFQNIIPNDKIQINFLYYAIISHPIQNILERFAVGTTFREVTNSTMKNIKIILPKSKKEQIKISEILIDLDDQIENERNYRDNLKFLKKGLMQILLTGKKRIKIE